MPRQAPSGGCPPDPGMKVRPTIAECCVMKQSLRWPAAGGSAVRETFLRGWGPRNALLFGHGNDYRCCESPSQRQKICRPEGKLTHGSSQAHHMCRARGARSDLPHRGIPAAPDEGARAGAYRGRRRHGGQRGCGHRPAGWQARALEPGGGRQRWQPDPRGPPGRARGCTLRAVLRGRALVHIGDHRRRQGGAVDRGSARRGHAVGHQLAAAGACQRGGCRAGRPPMARGRPCRIRPGTQGECADGARCGPGRAGSC